MTSYKFIDEDGIKAVWRVVKTYVDGKVPDLPDWMTVLPATTPPNCVLAGPESGTENKPPTFRKLVISDLPQSVLTEGLTTDEIDEAIL